MQYKKLALLALLAPLALGCDNREPNDKPGTAGLGNRNNGANTTALTRPGSGAPPATEDNAAAPTRRGDAQVTDARKAASGNPLCEEQSKETACLAANRGGPFKEHGAANAQGVDTGRNPSERSP